MPFPHAVESGFATQFHVPTPSDELLHAMRGFVVAKSIFVAARLGVADLLDGGPRGIDDIARKTSTHPGALYRLLRALSSIEIFTEVEPRTFALGRLGPGLVTGGPTSIRNWLLVNGGPIFRSFDGMLTSVQTGRPAFADTFGLSFFDFFDDNPNEGAHFDAAMDDVTRQTADAVLHSYDFADARSVVDVGGGTGALIAALLRAHPQMHGVLFDRPQVVAGAREKDAMIHLRDRCELVSGDFFVAVPTGADIYLLSWILHDWDDEQAVALLRSCRNAIPKSGRLLLVEAVLPRSAERHFAHFGDIVMLVALGGRERTELEYGQLLGAGGFRMSRIIPTGSPRSLIEAIPT